MLVDLWPSVPFLGFGVWLAWAGLAFSGTLWLSDVEINGSTLSYLFIGSNAAFAAVNLLAPFFVRPMKQLLASKRLIIGTGFFAGAGCLMIILAGPYYLGIYFEELWWLFWSGAVMSGLGLGFLGLKLGRLYGALPPRRVLLYASYSQIVVAFIYFTVMGSPDWALFEGGPTLVGVIAFVFLPVVTALVVAVDPREQEAESTHIRYSEQKRELPAAFWRLIAFSFFLPIVASMMRAMVVDTHALAVTVEGNNFLMLLRIPLAIVFILIAVRMDAKHMNFGKLYSFIAIAMVVAIACIPLFGGLSSGLSVVLYFASNVLEFAMWCLLAFVVFQKKISPIIVFGFGRGVFMLGSTVGWFLGAYVAPLFMDGSVDFAFYMICAAIILALSFLLFSERDYERLFSPIDENELALEDLLDAEMPKQKLEDKRGRFSRSIEHIAEGGNLSAREAEVFRYLAMGHGSDYIAEELQVSWNTVRTHTHNVYVKLGVHSRQDVLSLVSNEMKAQGETEEPR